MHLDEHIHPVGDQLRAAAALGDERTQQIAASLSDALHASIRLALMGAVSAAADETTAALLDADVIGSPTVSLALDGGDEVRVQVTLAPGASVVEPPRPDDGDATARISLRLPEAVKSEVETAAARESISVNSWLVRAATSALTRGAPSPGQGSHRITGWVTG